MTTWGKLSDLIWDTVLVWLACWDVQIKWNCS